MKKIFALMMILMLGLMTGCGNENPDAKKKDPSNKVIIYTSMKDSLIGGIVNGFREKYPDIAVDWQSAGAGKIMAKLDTERQNGRITADVIWTSEIIDFYKMKNEGLLEQYRPTDFEKLLNPFDDYDGFFTAARLGMLGIVINTEKISSPPEDWETIVSDSAYEDSFGIADPKSSGTAFMSMVLLEKELGWDYLLRLRENGIVKIKNSGRVVDETVDGNLSSCLSVDYVAYSEIGKGAPLKIAFPKKFLMVPSPVAIFKDSTHKDNAKKFVDYLLSKESQQKIADAGSVPVRNDVTLSERYNLPTPEEALKDGIKVNYSEVVADKDETLKKFSDLLK